MCSLGTLSLTIVKVFFGHESITRGERLNAIAYCDMGVAHVKYLNYWISLNLHALGYIRACVRVFLMWSIQLEGAQETSPMLNNEHV